MFLFYLYEKEGDYVAVFGVVVGRNRCVDSWGWDYFCVEGGELGGVGRKGEEYFYF